MANDVVYIHHRPAEFKAFRSPTGMAGRWTRSQAEQVAAHARLLAPKPGDSPYATGETVTSIRAQGPTQGRRGPEATVISATDHAVFVHEGTEPHTIKPRLAPKLVFFFAKAARLVRRDEVFHPGTKAQPFLLDALKKVFGGPGR